MRKIVMLTTVGAVVLLTACGSSNSHSASQAAKVDRAANTALLEQFHKSQPVPLRTWSQLRQNLIEIETAQADTTLTTSFFFSRDGQISGPVNICPSIGFPIPSTDQLTPDEMPGHVTDDGGQVPQLESNGVYVGDSTGTYVICVGDDGKAFIDYWEGDVQAVTGPATWDVENHRVKMTGSSTVKVTVGK